MAIEVDQLKLNDDGSGWFHPADSGVTSANHPSFIDIGW
jgi:hypothetical protein